MPSDNDVSASGRQSRTSTFSSSLNNSAMTGHGSKGDVLSTGSGVHSMLKTTTESGDLDFSSLNSRLPKSQRSNANRRPNGGAPSRTSSHYSRTGSVRSRGSNHSGKQSLQEPPQPMPQGQWPYNRHQLASSQDFSLPPNDARSGRAPDNLRSMPSVGEDNAERSSSLAHSQRMPYGLSNYRSMTSLRNQGPVSRPRSPFAYPTRLRRPGIRPASPALSDTTGAPRQRMHPRPVPGPRGYTSPHAPSYGADVDSTYPRRGPFSSSRSIDFLRNPSIGNQTQQGAQLAPLVLKNSCYSNSQRITNPTPSPSTTSPSTYSASWKESGTAGNSVQSAIDTAPYLGFVQRVKTVLEERISSDHTCRPNGDATIMSLPEHKATETPASLVSSAKKPARDIIKAAVDPSSDSAPTATQDDAGVRRLTREMIKAAVDDTSELNQEFSNDAIDAAVTDTDAKESFYEDSVNGVNHSFDIPSSTPTTRNVQSKASDDSCAISTSTSVASQNVEADYTVEFSMSRVEAGFGKKKNSATLDQDMITTTGAKKQSLEDTKPLNRPSSLPHMLEEQPANRILDRLSNTKSLPIIHDALPPSIETRQSDGDSNDHPSQENSVTPQKVSSDSDSCQIDGPAEAVIVPTHQRIYEPTTKVTVRTSIRTPDQNSESHLEEDYQLQTRSFDIARSSASSVRSYALRDSMLYFGDQSQRSTAHNSIASLEPRLSAMRSFHFPLSDLTEDSQESASTTNLRMLGAKPPAFRSGVKRSSNESVILGRAQAATSQHRSYLSRNLEDIHGIPSFNFSRVDLTAKLNSALGLRSSRSMEDVPNSRPSDSGIPVTEQTTSSDMVRGQYRSFFSDFENFADMTAEVNAAARKSQHNEILSELKSLSIPSVNALTLRLSELLPSINISESQLALLESGRIVKDTTDETCDAGSEQKLSAKDYEDGHPESSNVTKKVTNKNVEPNQESAESKEVRMLQLMKQLPPLPPGSEEECGSLPIAAAHRRDLEEVAELEATVSKHEAEAQGVHEIGATSPKKFKVKRPSEKAARGSPQPWHKDENYPWATGAPAMNISVAQNKDTPQTYLSQFKLKKSRSVADIPHDDTIRIVRSMSPGPRFDASLVPRTDLFTEPLSQSAPKRSLIGSLSKRFGRKPKIDKAGFPIDPGFLHPEERAFDPGDRYPTSGLTSPIGLNIEENRSYFSDDSSISDHQGGLLKRLNKLKPKRAGIRGISPMESPSDVHANDPWAQNDGSVFDDAEEELQQCHLQTLDEQVTAGMGKIEFRAKQVVEKLRTLKYKCGQLMRKKNKGKKKMPPSWYDHRQESRIYSGV